MGSEVKPELPGEPVTNSVAVLIVHDKIVAEGTAASVKNAKVKASERALEKLKGMHKVEFRQEFDCECKGETRSWVGQ